MTKTKIGIFGFGVVGQGLYNILQHYPNLGIHIDKIGVKHPDKERSLPADYFTYNRRDIIDDPHIELIAELTDDEEGGYAIVAEALKAGKKVVSANKKMLARNLPDLLQLQQIHDGYLLYEAAVCGSIPVIRTLSDYFGNEQLRSISGIFNGSSNYILSKIFNEHQDYATALKEAQEKGYAESDPTLDVGGHDAKYKLAIAAHHAFGITVDPETLPTFGIQNVTAFAEKQVRQHGQKLKLVSTAYRTANGGVGLLVIPQLVGKGERLYDVDEEYNALTIDAPFSGQQFFVGQGAGAHPTGSAVLSDIVAALEGYQYPGKAHEGLAIDAEESIDVYASFNRDASVTSLPFQTVYSQAEGVEGRSVTGSVRLQDLSTRQEEIAEKGIFLALIGDQLPHEFLHEQVTEQQATE